MKLIFFCSAIKTGKSAFRNSGRVLAALEAAKREKERINKGNAGKGGGGGKGTPPVGGVRVEVQMTA